ncbi:TPA: TcfC E-set like domain-containing protein [Stenotrophomonas maltophilia]|uniref:TcfC E-set like domain-containing protein n=1 Tax=Stenotrophomonas maltophilia TaxID=40324 RepID=UPI001463D3B0|nr:TcfC E-set like domain-containing protein [Stenotrophomonas maltophilia]MBH1381142.1 TcfC E-set like domain-containing protein [Stenotrophomonas maltophilia]MBH1398117.1 TcfC E-set like domain-containing protein [Stenotrophomonas maltophilia]MBH1470693.1 TcfC E-set like domain-containing protein [Stenotrophomonas maltophilia]MBH1472237.1 TcfC E-set like domain-containing protein [Stenotrophomonas maltophilia]MDZ5791988.1 TcfC E-set like domain-containing protein [Stenotrophomonas maltophili
MTPHAPAVTRLAVALALAMAAPLVAAHGVPAGFEDLVEGQTEQLDIQLFGRSAGLSPVRVTLEHVQLEDPAHVLQALDLPADAQAALLPALSQPLPRNSHLACRFGGATAGCGYLDPPEDPAVARALYDEGEGAVRLFVARQWIPGEPAAERYHKVTANAENAFLHQQTLNVSGGRDYQALSARGVGTLGLFDRGHLSADWYYTQQRYRSRSSNDDFQFDNVYYRHDLGPAHYLQAGRMDRRNLSSPQGGTFSFSMLSLDRFQGARVGTTQAYVDTDAAVQATPLTVLLARDARVDVFDGERLLQTFYLQAGINQIDTRNFPFGNYLVRMRIYEDGVLVRSEEAPFDKGGDWTNSQWQWFVQGGRRNERRSDRFDGESVAMAGARMPLGRDASITAGAANLGDHSYGELRLDLRRVLATHEMRATLSGMRGSDGSNGQQHQLSYRRKASWNLYQQRMRGKACQFEADARDQLGCTNSLSGSMSLPVAGGNAYVGYTRRQTWRTGWHRPGFEQDPLFGFDPLLPPGPLEPRREPVLSRTWQASFSRSHRWQDFSVSTRVGLWQQRSTDSVRGSNERDRGIYFNLSLTRLQRNHDSSGQRRYAVDVRQPQHQRPAIDYSVGQSLRQERDTHYRELNAELRANNNDRYSASLSGQLQNSIGNTTASIAHYQQRGRGETGYSGSHSSGFALGRRGFYWSGANGAEAGLAVQVDGFDDADLHGVAAELQVGGLRRQRLQIGERRLLPLQAYQSQRAEVQDASPLDSIAAIRVTGVGGARPMFLTPGKLMRMPVPIEVTYTFIGNAKDLAGSPLGGARILNAPVPGTSANGSFVADFPRRETTLYLLQDDRLLHCPLQVRERRQVVLLVGAVHCEPLAVAQLPPEIRQQARVNRLLQERALIAATPQTAAAGGTP